MTRDSLLLSLLTAGSYFVSESGVVFDRDRGEPRPPTPDADGHPVINIAECGTVRVSRLAAIQYYGLPPSGRHQVRHLNFDVADNRRTNIQWSSPKEMSAAAHAAGLIRHPNGADLPSTKLTTEQVKEARSLLAEGVSMRKVAARLGVTKGAIDGIKYGTSWRHV